MTAAVDAYVARIAASAPPLTAAQRERLTGLLRPRLAANLGSLGAADKREAVATP